ncbi:MAG TPA: DNA-binding protein WhiA [Firmicutes bacterium]|nr:DNA-binding protein WhiA [Candidatus Fermentithermobacillaceae bacterium]
MKIRRDTFSRTLKEELSRVEIAGTAQAFWEDCALRNLAGNKGGAQALRNQARRKQHLQTPKPHIKPYLLRRLFYLGKALSESEAAGGGKPDLSVLSSDSQSRRSFLRGVFLAKGSLVSPVRGHHLEMALPTEKVALLVRNLIAHEGLKGGLVKRRSAWVVYLKDADEISKFLALLGASRSVLQYEGIRVQKTVKSSVQRQVNMDKANVSRSVESCLRQIEDILLIEQELGLQRLPKALREISEARLNNQALTMQELGQSLNPPISKSAVNHRLRRIAQKADSLRRKSKREQ